MTDDGSTTLLTRIEAAIPDLSRSEATVASFVLTAPTRVVGLSIAALAEAAQVSEPTVARFAKSVGFSGLRELKIALARSLAGGLPYIHRDVAASDAPIEIAEKVFNRTIASLLSVRDTLDAGCLAAATAILAGAQRIEFYGQGNSGIVAQDGQHKFFRLGLPTSAYSDPHIHAMSAALLTASDAVVAISAGGRTLDLINSVRSARQAGAKVVGITAAGSPLARHCDVTIAADVFEDPDVYTPMTSRMAHLAIIDALAVSVALAKGPDLAKQLERAKVSLREKRFSGDAPGIAGRSD